MIRSGAVVLVTGATGAIGFEIAAQAAALGAVVGVHGSHHETVQGALARLRARVPEARCIAAPGDFRCINEIEAVVAQIAREGGRLDAVIHCAITGANGIVGPFSKTSSGGFGMHAALVLGVFQQLCFAALPHLAKEGGTIIGFASDAGRFAARGQAIVSGAFGGIMSFVRSLAVEVASDGVRVNCISPTFVEDTPTFAAMLAPNGRADAARARAGLGLPKPADIAPIALFLCGSSAAKITGQVISVNGGLNA